MNLILPQHKKTIMRVNSISIKSVVIFILLLLGSSLNAQQREYFQRNSFWTETVINCKIGGKFKWQLDYQYRRMSDPDDVSNANGNLFKYKFQHVYRPWIHYQLNESVRLSLSPLGFWETWTPPSEGGGKTLIQPEFRICPQLTLSNKIGRVMIDQRYRYEFRYIGTKVADTSGGVGYGMGMDFPSNNYKMRMRYFLRATIPLGKHTSLEDKTFYIVTWNEVFLGLGENTNNDKLWDQNRTFCLLGYKPKMKYPMRFELGYGLQVANRVSSSYNSVTNQLVETEHKIEKNNIMQVYVIFENFNLFFKKKKTEVKI